MSPHTEKPAGGRRDRSLYGVMRPDGANYQTYPTTMDNSEEWYQSIPKNVRPRKDQPFYHLLAENDEITYEAYVSQQNLLMDDSDEPIKHPLIEEIFSGKKGSSYFKMSN